MATLTINGQQVQVDDSFLSLSPEQQEATVDEIAQSLGPAPQESQQSQDLRAELSALTQNPGQELARQQFDALPGWQKPIVAGSDILQTFANGATFGFGDKAVAAVRAPFTGQSYEDELEGQRKLTRAAHNRAGGAGTAAEIAGAVALPVKLAGKGLTLAGRGGTAAMTGAEGVGARTALMGAEGAGYGALHAAGNDQDIGTGAALGLAGGIGGNLLGEGISAGVNKFAGMFNPKTSVPSVASLKEAGSAAFKRADAEGVMFNQAGVNKLRTNIIDDLTKRGFDPINEPGVMPVIKRLESIGQGNITFEGLKTLREVAGNGFRPGMNSNNAAIGKIIERIDELVDAADPTTILMGNNPMRAAAAVKEARKHWHTAKKLETVEKLQYRGMLNAGSSGSGGNVENATRQQVKKLLINETTGRGFNAAEKKAAEKVVLGSKTQNALRLAGKMSPQGNGLMLAIGGAGSIAAPHIAIPAMIAGYGAKKTAEHLSRRSVADLVRLISQGGDEASMKVVENAVQLLAKSKREALSRALMAVAVHEGNARHNQPSHEAQPQ